MLVYKWRLLPDWLTNGVLSREMAISACGLINGDFCLWCWWMTTSAYGLINDDFYLWCDEWRLLPMVWFMAISACGVMNDDFCLCFDWWKLLPYGWLVGFITRSGDFCQVSDRWALSLRDNYFTINWDVILGRMPIIGLIFGLYPICGLNMGFTPLVGLDMGFSSSVVYPFRLYPIHSLFEGLYWRALSPYVACLKGFIPIYCLFEGLYPHLWFEGLYPHSCFVWRAFFPIGGLVEGLYPDSVLIHLQGCYPQ